MVRFPMSEDVLKVIAYKACVRYGGLLDGLFTTASFQRAFQEVTGLVDPPGLLVESCLCGRDWVKQEEKSYCYWRLK